MKHTCRHKSGKFAKSEKDINKRNIAALRISNFNKPTTVDIPGDGCVSEDVLVISERIDQAIQTVPIHPATTLTATKVQGRRIVELDFLAVNLENGCITCQTPLKLINITNERLYGYTSALYVR